jgi:hypothetical protein
MSDTAPALDDAQTSENAPETKPAVRLGKKDEVEKPDRPTAERRFVAKSVNAFVQWMPLGGSGAAFASFCLQQNWAQAVMMFPVTAVTGVWAAYSESFVTRLSEIYKERGTKDADGLVKWMDGLDQAVRWQTSGFESKYLKCQAGVCEDSRIEGLPNPQGIFLPQLKEVFVPLGLSRDSLRHGPLGRSTTKISAKKMRALASSEDELLEIWGLLRRIDQFPSYKSMAILAYGGSGKTTLLRNITFIYANRDYRQYHAPKLVPILLYLRRWGDEIAKETPPTLPELIQMHMRSLPDGKKLNPPPNWAERILRCGEALVMFDGFDEVAEPLQDQVSQWISTQMREYAKSVFILTSRPGGYENYTAEKPQTQITVQGFNEEQRKRFINQWYWCQERYSRGGISTPAVRQTAEQNAAELLGQIGARKELTAMASNPLLLNMIATFHRSFPDIELPQQRTELYQEICKLQLGARPLAKKIRLLLKADQAQLVLQSLALRMVRDNRPSLPREEVVSALKWRLGELNLDIPATDLLKQFVETSELLVAEKSAATLEFSHLSFQGYLAATELDRLHQEDSLLEHVGDAWWKETILLYAAQLNDPSPFIRRIYQLGTSEAVRVAHSCWKETAYKTEPNLNLDIRQQWYQVLERQLQAKQWRDADKETYRLMITTVGKEDGKWLHPEDLSDFPCEDLLVLDSLWVRYSDGLWGFSVQKRIWKECGSPGLYDGTDRITAQWETFGDCVGWRKDGNWLESKNLALTSTGELPRIQTASRYWMLSSWGERGGGDRLWWLSCLVDPLFSRPDL